MRKTWRGNRGYSIIFSYYRPNIISNQPQATDCQKQFFMKHSKIIGAITFLLAASCNANKKDYDASGNFEADEVIVSAQQTGELLSFSVREGDHLNAGTVVGQVDTSIPKLQKEQTEATIAALKQKTSSADEQTEVVKKQRAVQQTQLENLYREQKRTTNLVKA